MAFQHAPEDALEAGHVAQLCAGPLPQERGAGADAVRDTAPRTRASVVVEREVVLPGAVDGAADLLALGGRQEAAFGAVRAAPVHEGEDISPGVGDGASGEELLEEGEGVRRVWAPEVTRLGGVVGDEEDGWLEGPDRAGGGGEEDREAMGWKGEEGV